MQSAACCDVINPATYTFRERQINTGLPVYSDYGLSQWSREGKIMTQSRMHVRLIQVIDKNIFKFRRLHTIPLLSEKPTAHQPLALSLQMIWNSTSSPSSVIEYKMALPIVSLKQPTVMPQPSAAGVVVTDVTNDGDDDSFIGCVFQVVDVVEIPGVKSSKSDVTLTLRGDIYGVLL
jgi:hypothetical protein